MTYSYTYCSSSKNACMQSSRNTSRWKYRCTSKDWVAIFLEQVLTSYLDLTPSSLHKVRSNELFYKNLAGPQCMKDHMIQPLLLLTILCHQNCLWNQILYFLSPHLYQSPCIYSGSTTKNGPQSYQVCRCVLHSTVGHLQGYYNLI